MLVCRVCGKNYEACLSKRVGTTFRWQDVACSPECGTEYLHRIYVSRGLICDSPVRPEVKESTILAGGFDEDDIESDNEFNSDDFGA